MRQVTNDKPVLTWILGASGVGELLANTLAVRNVNVVVLDVHPIVTENCASSVTLGKLGTLTAIYADNITYYKCDVSKWEEVEAVSKLIIEEVSFTTSEECTVVDIILNVRSVTQQSSLIMLVLFKGN